MNYKYNLAYKVSSKEEVDKLISHLVKLGYKKSEHGLTYLKDSSEYLIANEKYSIVQYNSMIYRNAEIITNKELFLALAAMRDDDKFHVGEYVYRISEKDIHKIVEVNIDKWLGLEGLYQNIFPNTLNYHNPNRNFIRKATKEEIISLFTKQDKIWEVGDVVEAVGSDDKYRIEADKYSNMYTITSLFSSTTYRGYSSEFITYTINKGDWKLIKQDNKTMEKKSFTVEGSIHLKKALLNDVEDCGIKVDVSINITTSNYIFAASGIVNQATETNYKQDIHYKLPAQYNEAKQAFLDLIVPEYIKWLGQTSSWVVQGAIYKVVGLEDDVLRIINHKDNNDGVVYKSSVYVRATKEDYDTYQELIKPKDIIYKLKCDNGEFDIKITKDYIYYKEEKEPISKIISLERFMTGGSGSNNILGHRCIIHKVDIGCDQQLKGVTSKHLEDIISLHNKHFK